mgnify:CR=1 FL=1
MSARVTGQPIVGFGIDAHEPLRAVQAKGHPLRLRTRDVYRFPWGRHARGLGRAAALLPKALTGRGGDKGGFLDTLFDLHREMPSGVFSNDGLGGLLQRVAAHAGRRDAFEDLLMPVRITATNLNHAGRAVYGAGYELGAPVSGAVRASTCIPYYMHPVTLLDQDLIDGQIVDPIHLDLAVTPDVRVVFAVSPLATYDVNAADSAARDAGRLGRAGAAIVLDQSARIAAGVKERASRRAFEAEHPDVHVVDVRPAPDDVFALMNSVLRPGRFDVFWRMGHRAGRKALQNLSATSRQALAEAGLELPGLTRAD